MRSGVSEPAATVAATPEISIVVPAFNESGNLGRLHRLLSESLSVEAASWELVFADDGSQDGTWSEILALHAMDPRVRGVRLSRNFGHQYALLAGMAHASGEAIVTMDADLQHPPDVVPRLIQEWRDGNKIVHTVRLDSRGTSFIKRTTSRLFYRVFSYLSGVTLDPGMADFRLLDRQVADVLIQSEEGALFLRGLVQWVGFPSSRIAFHCRERFAGTSKYTPRRMLKFARDGIGSFSVVPLRMATLAGFITSGLAILVLLYALVVKIGGFYAFPGWASILSVVSFLFGVLFIVLGIMGEYLGAILTEVKGRPRFIVREDVGSPTARRGSPDPERRQPAGSLSASEH